MEIPVDTTPNVLERSSENLPKVKRSTHPKISNILETINIFRRPYKNFSDFEARLNNVEDKQLKGS